MHIRLALAAAAVVAFAACDPAPSPAPSAAVPSGTVPSGTVPAVTLAPEATASEPGPSVLLTCGGEERFPSAALAGPGLAEFENDAATVVLKAIIAEPADPDMFPDHGWHRVVSDPGGVLFVAPGQGVPWVRVAATPGPDGWFADLYGECQAQPVMPAGIGLADFWLDPAAPRPGPDATTLSGLIRERSCAGGQPPEGRIQAPVVVVSEDSVVITITVRQQPGGQDCPANPESAPITIELGQPLGDRVVLDGSVFPPRETSVPPA